MKKTVAMLFSIILMAGLLFANGQGETTSGSKDTDFPKKEITVIVPWNPGGTNDLMARAMQPIAKSMYNIDLVVKNVPGGGSAVGIAEVLTAKPDGYTIGLASSSYLALMAQGRVATKMDEMTNIVNASSEPVVLVTKKGGTYATAKELIDVAIANPGKVSCGIPGSNNVNQAYATLLAEATKTTFNFMPFDGGSRVVAELLGGHVDCGVLKPSEVITQVRAGGLVVLGVFNKEGLGLLPEVPTIEKVGYDVFRLGNIQQTSFLMGPKGMDQAIVDKIVDIFTNILNSDEYKKFGNDVGIVPTPISGPEFVSYLNEVYAGLEKASAEIFTK
ncbi:MAG: tripartite tricarboxylate transporter substrate binding protein [Sphaerochaetaceae bacterium]|nr:tripartite tricarboxylate transporter substrate binding protein [Sphaerochaetaceae bacterium]